VASPTGAGPYGFVVAIDCQAEHSSGQLHRVGSDGLVRASGNGAVWTTRHYANTPESALDAPPLVTNRSILVYEGRVDNRGEVAHALARPEVAVSSDGMVLLAAFEAWGAQLPARLIGEYAFAAIDRVTGQFVAAHDSLGVRRVFYRDMGDRAWITSNLDLLFEQFPEARPAIDRDALPEYFAGPMIPWSGRTIWRGVRELRRGGVLVHRRGIFEERTVWQPKSSIGGQFKNPTDVDAAYRGLLFEAVRGALRSTGPILCDLSGGLDSSTICSVASQLARAGEGYGSIVGWSTVNRRSNDRALQEAVHRHCGVEWQALDIQDYLPFQAIRDSALPTGGIIQCEAADRAMREFAGSRGIRCRLSGHGADALMQKGHPAPVYLSEWFWSGQLRKWARAIRAYASGGSFDMWHLLRECTLGTLDFHAGLFRRPLPDWLRQDFVRQIEAAQHDFLHRHRRTFASDARERVFRMTLCFVPYNGRMLPDERLPLVYRPLVEFVLALDWEHLVKPNEDRVLMRRALRGLLPEDVRHGTADSRHGASITEGLRQAWPRVAPLLTGNRLAELGVVELKPFQNALRALRGGYEGSNPQFTKTAMYLEAWLSMKARSTERNAAEVGRNRVPTAVDRVATSKQPETESHHA
jgi:asparagine synthase (glutamine-hydrolysing)